MAEVSAVRTLAHLFRARLWSAAPVAATLAGLVTASVAGLVRVSEYPSSSVNDTLTFILLPTSSAVRRWVLPVAPGMSASSLSHW